MQFMSTPEGLALHSIRDAAFEVLTGQDTIHARRILDEARRHGDRIRTEDPQTYDMLRKAIIERIRRSIRRP